MSSKYTAKHFNIIKRVSKNREKRFGTLQKKTVQRNEQSSKKYIQISFNELKDVQPQPS